MDNPFYQFVSGLPRAGSTLFAALLRQQPRFVSNISTPPLALMVAAEKAMNNSEFNTQLDDAQRTAILRSALDCYYIHANDGQIVFDLSRGWTGKLALLNKLFPHSTIFCLVRPVEEIVNSLERMLERNPLRTSKIFGWDHGASVYTRVDLLTDHKAGLVGRPWSNLREACYGPLASKLVLIHYDFLVDHPAEVLKKIYEKCKASSPLFKGEDLDSLVAGHDLNNVELSTPDYDEALGTPGLHRVHGPVQRRETKVLLPPEMVEQLKELNFWEKDALPVGATWSNPPAAAPVSEN